jgi:hypothetical protein
MLLEQHLRTAAQVPSLSRREYGRFVRNCTDVIGACFTPAPIRSNHSMFCICYFVFWFWTTCMMLGSTGLTGYCTGSHYIDMCTVCITSAPPPLSRIVWMRIRTYCWSVRADLSSNCWPSWCRSSAPTAFTGYSFHVVEAIIVFANEILLCFVLPLDLGLHRCYHIFTTLIHQGVLRYGPPSACF